MRARGEVMRFTESALDCVLRDIENPIAIGGENAHLLGVKAEIAWQYYNLGVDTSVSPLAQVRLQLHVPG